MQPLPKEAALERYDATVAVRDAPKLLDEQRLELTGSVHGARRSVADEAQQQIGGGSW